MKGLVRAGATAHLTAARASRPLATAAPRLRGTSKANANVLLCKTASEGENGRYENREEGEASQEKFIDVTDILKDVPDDHVFEGAEGEEGEAVWVHEARFARDADDAQPIAKVKGALDPDQADILSAYSTEQGFREVDVHYAAYHMQDSPDVEVIDVRTPSEYQTGHIAGSRNVCLDELSQAVKDGSLTARKPLAIICARGGRSAQACVRLSKVFGFESVTNISGGMNAWIGAGFPVTQ